MRFRILACLILTAALLVGPDHAAFGASFTVDSTVDAVDANPGDGVCADPTGACTLRAAIQETNALPGADIIGLDFETYTLSIPGAGEDASATGDLDITDDLGIRSGVIVNGAPEPGSVIDGGGLDRVLHILGDVTVEITGVAIQNGLAAGGFDPNTFELGMGGGIFSESGASLTLTNAGVKDNDAGSNGGGINTAGTLTMIDSEVSGNSAGHIFESFGGAGVANSGGATLIGSVVSGNNSGLNAGGIANGGSLDLINSAVKDNTAAAFVGGGISSGGTLTVTSSIITGNTIGVGSFLDRGEGGGIHNLGVVTVTTSTIAGNLANAFGGGIANDAGSLILDGVTVSGNGAPGGAGIANGTGQASPSIASTLEIVNSTISGNSAGSMGGGIVNGGGINAAATTLTNVTVASNSAGLEGGGIFNNPAGTVALKNTIVARSIGANCIGPVTSSSRNLDTDGTCGGPNDFSPGELLLGPLADNGGPTLTHALLPGHGGGCQGDACFPPAVNFAIDGGEGAACPETDQRGAPRPVDGNADGAPVCDIGAYEAGPATAATPPPTGGTGTAGPAQLPPTGKDALKTRGDTSDVTALGVDGFVGLLLSAMAGLAALRKTEKRNMK